MGTWRVEGQRIHAGKVAYLISEGINSYCDGPERYVGHFEGSKEDAERICASVNASNAGVQPERSA